MTLKQYVLPDGSEIQAIDAHGNIFALPTGITARVFVPEMGASQGRGLILPPGSVPKVRLSGEMLHVKLLSYSVADGWNAVVAYPDGYLRHHQVYTVVQLLDKIAGQLKTRYNLTDFKFMEIPAALEPSTIKIGEITYA